MECLKAYHMCTQINILGLTDFLNFITITMHFHILCFLISNRQIHPGVLGFWGFGVLYLTDVF